jgi:hypothetical protein
MWNSTGTVSVTNGSPVVTGAGTVFSFPNAQPGQAFLGPNGLPMEIASVDSASQITLARPYGGATAAGQPFTILPTQSFANDLALAFAGFKNTAGAMLDTIGQGMFTDGSIATPGIRFAADQDTGLVRTGENAFGVSNGGILGVSFERARTIFRAVVSGENQNQSGADQTYHALNFYSNAGLNIGGISAYKPINGFVDAGGLIFSTAVGSAVERMRITHDGKVGIGTSVPTSTLDIALPGALPRARFNSSSDNPVLEMYRYTGSAGIFYGSRVGMNLGAMTFEQAGGATIGSSVWAERMRLDDSGNLLVGVTGGSTHAIAKNVPEGSDLLYVYSPACVNGAVFGAVNQQGWNSAKAAFYLGKHSSTGRSASFAGTINAGGADYAEYVRKSLACGTILKGDVCGIDCNGQLTRTWADARRYVVKSTDPNLVGGDTWAAHLGPRPEAPLYDVPAYDGPAEPAKPVEPAAFVPPVIEMPVQPVRGDGEDDDAYLLRLAAFLDDRAFTIAQAQAAAAAQIEAAKAQAAYAAALEQYQADLAAYRDAQAAHRTAIDAAEAAHAVALAKHAEALTAWEAELEAARQTVDRIAFSGQVPVNVDPDTLAACQAALGDGAAVYLVAVPNGDGIGVAAVRETDMTLPLYMHRLGAVWAIRDSRPWVDVQHG